MKIQKKEENVFSTSALDLFCSAMGVFMLLCFVVMPYYRNEQSEQKPDKPDAQDVSVITPSLTVAISWRVDDIVLKKNSKGQNLTLPKNFTIKGIKQVSCDFDMYIHEMLPGIDKAFLHDFQHIGIYPETGARLVADSQRGGSEAWVQPAVKAGESCDVFAVLFTRQGLSGCDDYLASYNLVLHVLVLSGNGKTEEWEMKLNKQEAQQLELNKQELDNIKQAQKGFTSAQEGGAQFDDAKRLPLLRIKVGQDYTITSRPLPNSRLKQISK